MKKEVKMPCIFYHYIYSRIREKFPRQKEITVKEAKKVFYTWRIPKNLQPVMIRELELLGLIKRKRYFYLELFEEKIDFDDTSSIYKEAGIYG